MKINSELTANAHRIVCAHGVGGRQPCQKKFNENRSGSKNCLLHSVKLN